MSSSANTTNALPLQIREAPITKTTTLDRTIQVIWTTGATVVRRGFPELGISEPCDEILLVTDDAVDLSRLKAGAAVLDSHQTETVASQRAIVEDAWIQGGKGYASARFPKAGLDPASDRLFVLAKDGIIRNVSVGYAINRVRVVKPTRSGERIKVIAERWTPHELSFVAVPADIGAKVLTGNQRLFPVEVVRGTGGIGIIRSAAARLRMSMRAYPCETHTALNAYAAELRLAGIDPRSDDATRARIGSLEQIFAERARKAGR